MSQLILIRHGQSQWNLENRFTGWVDVPLSPKGIQEAISAGKKLQGIRLDAGYVSHMLRAIQTLYYVLGELTDPRTLIIHHEEARIRDWERHSGKMDTELPIYQSVELAERYYGDLQGLNKDETRKKYGEAQVHLWRRSYDVRPPGGESLKDTCERTIPYYQSFIEPELRKGKTLLVVAHGNSLRSIVKYVENIPDETIPSLEIPTGVPLLYTFKTDGTFIDKRTL